MILYHPFWFTIMAEALDAILSKATGISLIVAFEVGHDREVVGRFADDTILFSPIDWEEIANLSRILGCFKQSSGLKINLSKSVLVG